MKSFREIGKYWRSEYPDRKFERVRPLLLLSRLSFLMPAFQKDVLAPHGLSPSDYSILGALRRAKQLGAQFAHARMNHQG